MRPLFPRWQHVTPRNAPVQTGVSPRDRRWAAATHLSALVLAAVGMLLLGRPVIWATAGVWLAPAAMALYVRHDGTFARHHAREALGFAILIALAGPLLGAGLTLTTTMTWGVVLVPALLLGVLLLAANWFVLSLYGAAEAARGALFSYPFVPAALRNLAGRLSRSPHPG